MLLIVLSTDLMLATHRVLLVDGPRARFLGGADTPSSVVQADTVGAVVCAGVYVVGSAMDTSRTVLNRPPSLLWFWCADGTHNI